MPPAFVLSQDQTLKTIVSKQLFAVQTLFRSSFWLNTNLTLLRYFVKIEKYILLKVITGSCLSLRCLIFKVLAVAPELSLSRGDLFILSHFQAFVKRFFKLFSKFFFGCLCRRSKTLFFAFNPSVNFFSASRFSVKSFSSEIRCSCRFSAFFLLSRATALLSYHLFLLLSTPFF